MLTLEEAYRRLLTHVQPAGTESISLTDAIGRVLVEPRVLAAVDVPPFANSAMDGFAVRAADTPGSLRVIGEVAAGAVELPSVEPGTAVGIMTGAPLPPGADAVVPIEDATEADGVVSIAEAVLSANQVRAAAHDTRAGDEICLPGALTPARIAVLASLGIGDVSVWRRPVVAILSTGNELVGPGDPLGPGQIHDADGVALAAAVTEAGGEPLVLPRQLDEEASIESALMDAAGRADLVVTSGGVSVGRHDYVRAVLQRNGSLDFWRVAVQPGKPLAVGALGGATVIGLPGNPVSALVTFELFVRPFIRSMLGLTGDGRLHVRATPTVRMATDPPRRAFLRVGVWHEYGDIHARPAGGQASSQLRPMADANGLLVVPEGHEAAEPGQSYEAIVFEPLELQSWR
ncbi:MAG: molybdopterin molybdotransferase [Chloroflexota bacterium]|nr:molybdopterin molybdotransferase [Chloroflexota bacterium]